MPLPALPLSPPSAQPTFANSDLDKGEDKNKDKNKDENKDENKDKNEDKNENKDEDKEDKEDEGEDKNKEPVETEHKDSDTLSPLLPPPVRFTSVWKATVSGGKETLPGIKSAIYNTNNLYLFQLEEWRE